MKLNTRFIYTPIPANNRHWNALISLRDVNQQAGGLRSVNFPLQ